MKLTKENQGSLALFLWFAFLNSQLLLGVFAFLSWRISNPRVPLSGMVFWDPTIGADPVSLVLLVWVSAAAAVGFGLGIRYFSAVKQSHVEAGPRPPAKLIIAYVLLDVVAGGGMVLGMLRGNVLLAVPFLGVAALLLVLLIPLGNRFPGRRS